MPAGGVVQLYQSRGSMCSFVVVNGCPNGTSLTGCDLSCAPICSAPPTSTPTASPTGTPTDTSTQTPTVTPTLTNTSTDTPTATPTDTPTATATQTPTLTNTPTTTPTTTPVHAGGPCTQASQCATSLFCLNNVCNACTGNAPAPATSCTGLLIGLGILAAIADIALWRRRELKHYLWSV